MDAHRVEVLHVADGDARVGRVTHDLVFDLFPAHERSFDEDLADRRRADAALRDRPQRVAVVREAATCAAERERGTDDEREADPLGEHGRVVDIARGDRLRYGLADRDEQLLECLAVLGLLDRAQRRSEEAHAVALEDARFRERDRKVEAGLPAERGQQAVGPLLRDDPLEHVDRERFYVCHVRDAGVGHDRRGVRVHEDRLDALLAKRPARLRPGVVELGGLADDDRTGADDQDSHRWIACRREL